MHGHAKLMAPAECRTSSGWAPDAPGSFNEFKSYLSWRSNATLHNQMLRQFSLFVTFVTGSSCAVEGLDAA